MKEGLLRWLRLSEIAHPDFGADESVADAKDQCFALAAAGFSGAVAMKSQKAGGPKRVRLEQQMVAQALGIAYTAAHC